jgi:hypothetical protein
VLALIGVQRLPYVNDIENPAVHRVARRRDPAGRAQAHVPKFFIGDVVTDIIFDALLVRREPCGGLPTPSPGDRHAFSAGWKYAAAQAFEYGGIAEKAANAYMAALIEDPPFHWIGLQTLAI